MEKIYMEDSQSQQSKKSRSQIRLSVVLSFVVAFFAIFSLIACGVSQVSYAAPTDGEIVDDNFTFKVDSTKLWVQNASGQRFAIPMYYANEIGGKAILCIEPTVDVPDGAAYQRGGQVLSDPGLLYLLSQFYDENGDNKNIVGALSGDYGNADTKAKMTEYANEFVKQAAVWLYVTQKGYASNLDGTETGSVLKEFYNQSYSKIYAQDRSLTPELYIEFTSNDADLIYQSVKLYVRAAVEKTSFSSISLTNSSSLSKNDNGDYQIGYEVASEQGTLLGYKIEVLDSNDTAYDSSKVQIVDENGQVIENGTVTCTATSCPNKFAVIVSKDMITQTQTDYVFNVSITGNFESLTGGVYQAIQNPDENQKVITVSASSNSVGTRDQFIISEDTGMTTAQTIYFIGLVVLLCGIGIVYANAKPAESKQ